MVFITFVSIANNDKELMEIYKQKEIDYREKYEYEESVDDK
jgi:hypothetical protein